MILKKKRFLISLLAVSMLFSLATVNAIAADEVEEEIQEEVIEETNVENLENEEVNQVEQTTEEVSVIEHSVDVTIDAISPMSAGVSTLVADETTLAEAFPDANFRSFVAKTVLGNTSYDDSTGSTAILTAADITKITARTSISVANLNISSMEGIQHFVNVTSLACQNNQIADLDISNLTKITGLTCQNNQLTVLDVSNLVNITRLDCSNNNISELNITSLIKLSNLACGNNNISVLDTSNLTDLVYVQLYSNPISELIIPDVAKANILTLNYRSTSIDSLDLTGFTSLTTLAMSKATNANFTNISALYVTGSRVYSDASMVRVLSDIGSISWDAGTGYYAIAASSNATYGFTVNCPEIATGSVSLNSVKDLSEGGLMDNEGNLIVGAVLGDVEPDGTITLSNGGTIATPEGIFTFEGSVSIKDGIITTNDNYTFAKNTADVDSETGTATANIEDVITYVEVGDGTSTISTNGSEMEVPSGTVVTNDAGDKTIVTGEGTVDSDGNVTSNDIYLTVPADKAGEITTGSDGNIMLPEGSVVNNGGEEVTYPGNIVYDTEDNTIKYLPIDELLNSNGNDLASDTTQEDISNAQDLLDSMEDSLLKTELQDKVDTAQDILNAKDAIEDLFDDNDSLKDTVTQDDIDNAEDLINKIPDGDLKEELKDKLEEAQKELNERTAEDTIEDLFKPDGSGEIKDDLTQEDIDNAQDQVNNLPDGDKKEELQDKLDEAQKQLDEKNAENAVEDLFKPDNSGEIRDDLTQEDIDNAQDLVNNLPDGDKKKELQDKLNEAQKQLDEKLFVVIEQFAVFRGIGSVYTKIDAPVERFSKVYIDGKELAISNYEVTSGSTIITLKESYLKTLANGDYMVEVEFDSGARISTTLSVDVEISDPSIAPPVQTPDSEVSSTITTSDVNTGDTTDLGVFCGMITVSLLGLFIVIKRKPQKD